jgi:hypothetical protein
MQRVTWAAQGGGYGSYVCLCLEVLAGVRRGVDSLLPGLARLPAAARAAGVFVGGKTSPAGPGVGTWAGV